MPPRPREVLRVLQRIGFEEKRRQGATGYYDIQTADRWSCLCIPKNCPWALSAVS